MNPLNRHVLRRATAIAGAAVAAGAIGATPMVASAASPGRTLAADTRFYTPPPASGEAQQWAELTAKGDTTDAALLAQMSDTAQAVWLTGETAAESAEGAAGSLQADRQVFQQIRRTLGQARGQDAVPIFVIYNIPGRDCSQYSAGGAPSDAAYQQWIDAVARGVGDRKAVFIVEPDGLANLPSDCGAAYQKANPQITDATREADIAYAVTKLEMDPQSDVYMDAGHSAWHSVGDIATRLVAAGVQSSQGFFLNVSNYQYSANSVFYGVWVSDCIALGGGSLTYNYSGNCPNQYWNGGPANNWTGTAMSPFGVWSETASQADLNTAGIDSRFGLLLGSSVPTTHFVVDTSRNGQGPNSMQLYAGAPYSQPSSVISTLQGGNWCNPPGAGLGLGPTADTSGIPASLDSYQMVPSLLDAYLWVKTPGQSDGQCDAAGGVRAWDNSAYTPTNVKGWPGSTSSRFQEFDPLWSLLVGEAFNDPAAGAWFSQQALQLAQNANPPLPTTRH